MAEDDVPGGPPVGAVAPVVAPHWPWVTLFAVFGAALCAYGWATTSWTAKPLGALLVDQARGIGIFVILCALAGLLGNWRRPFQGLRLPLTLVPFYLLELIAGAAFTTVGWEGGWILGIAGAAAGAMESGATGWMLIRLMMEEALKQRKVVSGAVRLPGVFAVLFALYGAYSWATARIVTLDEAWAIVIFPIVFALLGALVMRPLLGLLAGLPLVLVQLVPLVASMKVEWEGGWVLGIAGAATGAIAGAATGWLYNRWIMPEYAKRRRREMAAGP